ncbi:hypothetical protein G9F32_14105 [Acinetobacter sp. 194]|nr:NF045616 family extracytoplasmic (lipo)protein [Acinetobacter shaoyimingii]NHB59138.1 hypothetical protein [Acinetobacter shaoyimingii]
MSNNETLIYLGKIDENIEFTSSYSKTYKNLKMPINEENCLQIPLSHFEIGKPYEIWLETHEEYKQRICLSKSSNQIQLVEVIDGYTCGKEQYDYSGSNIFEKLQIF